MAPPILFGGSSSSQSQNKYLVEFRAGKMSMKNMVVTADKRKGTVYVYQTDDSLMHFCWKDRTSGIVEDDLIIFPDDVVFKKVPECKTGRVFVLKFKSSSRRCFYWMQEPKADKDTEYCSKVNQYLNNPPAGGSSRGGASGSSSSGGLRGEVDGDLHNLISSMSQQQLVQLLGGVTNINQIPSLSTLLGSASGNRLSGQSASSGSETSPSVSETPQPTRATAPTTITTTSTPAVAQPSATAATPAAASIQLQDLQSILSGISSPAGQAEGQGAAAKPSVDLSAAMTVEALQPLFDNQELMDRVRSLLPASAAETPAVGPTPDNLRNTVLSPQFQQALGVFSSALQSGQLGPLMQQFGMSPEVVTAAAAGDMDTFVKALQNSKESKDKKDADKDDDMALD